MDEAELGCRQEGHVVYAYLPHQPAPLDQAQFSAAPHFVDQSKSTLYKYIYKLYIYFFDGP